MINQKKARLYNSKIIDDLFKKDKDALDIPVNAARIFKPIIFKKIPKKEDGRCIKCDARNLCGGKFRCECNIDQQYQKRWFIK